MSIAKLTYSSFCALVSGIGLFATSVLAAGPEPGVNVTVTNPPTQPVPVTGSLGVSGSVTVSSGSVTVSNSASSPVPVLSVNPEGVAFMIAKSLSSNGGNQITIATVPAGSRYLVEHASASCSIIPSQPLAELAVGVSSASGRIAHFLVPVFLGEAGVGTRPGFLAASTPIRFEAGPGTSLFGRVSPVGLTTGDTLLQCDFTLSGRSFVD